jgi:hypothetical protein
MSDVEGRINQKKKKWKSIHARPAHTLNGVSDGKEKKQKKTPILYLYSSWEYI